VEFYTHKERRDFTSTLKNMHSLINLNEIKEELNDLHHIVIDISNMKQKMLKGLYQFS